MKKHLSTARSVVADLESAASKRGNGCLESIIRNAGSELDFDVYVWPSADALDAGLRRGVAYARASIYMEDKYLVTMSHAPQLENCISLYDRMRAGIHACLTEHKLDSHASRKLLTESAQVLMLEFAHRVFPDGDWEEFAQKVDEQVRALGGRTTLPVRDVEPCSEGAAHAADWALLKRLPSIRLGQLQARGGHLSLVK